MARISRLPQGSHIHDEVAGLVYSLDRFLGQGGFGAAYLSTIVSGERAKRGTQVCLKYSETPAQWHGEVYFNGLLKGRPHVVQMRSAFPATVVLRGGRKTAFFISTDFMSNGTINDYIDREDFKPWSERQVVFRVRQLLKPLILLHKMGVSHRDITPQNVFLGEHHKLLLGDFGITKAQLHTSGSRVDAYNPAFSPKDLGAWWNPADDVYQVGLLMSSLLAGEAVTHDVRLWDVNKLASNRELREIIKSTLRAKSKRPADATQLCERLDVIYSGMKNHS